MLDIQLADDNGIDLKRFLNVTEGLVLNTKTLQVLCRPVDGPPVVQPSIKVDVIHLEREDHTFYFGNILLSNVGINPEIYNCQITARKYFSYS